MITSMLAQTGEWHARTLGEALLHTALFGLVGIVIVFIGLKVFDKAMTGVDLEKEVARGNVAAGILSGAAIIALAIIIAAAMS
jgi:putative membrane protein